MCFPFLSSFKMSSILTRFENLNISDESKNPIMAYLTKVKAEKLYFILRNNFILLPAETGNKFILLEFVKNEDNKTVFLCSLCSTHDRNTATVTNNQYAINTEKDYCLHSNLAFLLYGDNMDTSDIKDEDMVEIVANANKPKFISVVHPSSISNKGPGVVYI